MDPRELNHLFEQMSPAPDQEEAILARLQAPEKAVKNPSRRWKKSVFVLTAAAAMALACAAAAFSALDPRLLSFFQRTPQDTELLGAGVVAEKLALELVDVFLATEFAGGRHGRRVNKLMALETEG